MTDKDKDALARAIDSLGAVQVRPESGQIEDDYSVSVQTSALYAFFDHPIDTESTWFVGDVEAVATFSAQKSMGITTYYEPLVAMPSWWAPTQQSVWRITLPGANQIYVREDDYRQFGKPRNAKSERVTVNLETGEEVRA